MGAVRLAWRASVLVRRSVRCHSSFSRSSPIRPSMTTRPSSRAKILSGADIILIGALMALVGTTAGVSLAAILRDDRTPVARTEAALIAEELLAVEGSSPIQVHASARRQQRGPASADETSPRLRLDEGEVVRRDPWGQPYRYKAQRDSQGRLVALVVWSVGPNGVSQTAVAGHSGADDHVLGGDDVGSFRDVTTSDQISR
jgi:hypothetical protein